MSTFDFIKNNKHTFYPLKESDVQNAESRLGIKFPIELKEFYKVVGYGFLHNGGNSFNRFLDPDTIADIKLREGIYEFDPDLDDIYEEEDKLVFLEVNEGVYLELGLHNNADHSAVYYFEDKIADSLEDFLRKIDEKDAYYMDMVE